MLVNKNAVEKLVKDEIYVYKLFHKEDYNYDIKIKCGHCEQMFSVYDFRKREARGDIADILMKFDTDSYFKNICHTICTTCQTKQTNISRQKNPVSFFWTHISQRSNVNFTKDEFKAELDVLDTTRCNITGLQVQYIRGSNCFNQASVDRIDSSGKYETGNIQVVCLMLNRAKKDFDKDVHFDDIVLLDLINKTFLFYFNT